MGKGKLFLFLNLSFLGGIFLFWLFQVSLILIYLFGAALIILGVSFWQDKKIRSFYLLLIFAAAGLFRGFFSDIKEVKENNIENFSEKEAIVEGVVSEEVLQTEKNTKIVLSKLNFKFLENKENFSPDSKILVFSEPYAFYEEGYILEAKGEISKPKMIESFNYPKYLKQKSIIFLMFKPEIKIIGKEKQKFLYNLVLNTKTKFKEAANYVLPHPHSSILTAMILGFQNEIPKDIKESFRKSGTIHIMAVSGFNISIIAATLLFLLLGIGFSRKGAFYFTTFGIIFFVILVGAPPSAIRAGIMGFLFLLAIHLGRLSRAANAVIFTASLMLFIEPSLLESISFELSFLATLGIIYFYPLFLETFFEKVPDFLKLKSVFFVTISAQILTLPVIIHNFKEMSLIAPLINILVLPVVPLITILGLLSLLLYFVFKIFGLVFAWPSFLLIEYLLRVVITGGNFPLSTIKIEWFNGFFVAIYYLILIFVYFYLKNKTNAREKNNI